jgi:hypothetical protein
MEVLYIVIVGWTDGEYLFVMAIPKPLKVTYITFEGPYMRTQKGTCYNDFTPTKFFKNSVNLLHFHPGFFLFRSCHVVAGFFLMILVKLSYNESHLYIVLMTFTAQSFPTSPGFSSRNQAWFRTIRLQTRYNGS